PLGSPIRRSPSVMRIWSTCCATTAFVSSLSGPRPPRPHFRLTTVNAAAVVDICIRLDGIPLELAAVRVRGMGVGYLSMRLDDRFRLLTGGDRAALPRQQTLHTSPAWSYGLLPEAERAILRRLGTFVGGFSLEAAEAVCAGEYASESGRATILPA